MPEFRRRLRAAGVAPSCGLSHRRSFARGGLIAAAPPPTRQKRKKKPNRLKCPKNKMARLASVPRAATAKRVPPRLTGHFFFGSNSAVFFVNTAIFVSASGDYRQFIHRHSFFVCYYISAPLAVKCQLRRKRIRVSSSQPYRIGRTSVRFQVLTT